MTREEDIAALIGSRICHDLISPLGAIGNGLELLAMAPTRNGRGAGGEAELALISESAGNANARIRFFRIAYGAAPAGARLGLPEVRSVVGDIARGGRLAIDWRAEGDFLRADVKLAFLALQCVETAMPYGGRVEVSRGQDGWRVHGAATKLKVEAALWARLSEGAGGPGEAHTPVGPAQVQFALLPRVAADQGCSLAVTLDAREITIAW